MKKNLPKVLLTGTFLTATVFAGISINDATVADAGSTLSGYERKVEVETIKTNKLVESGSIKYKAEKEKGHSEVDVLVSADSNKVTKKDLKEYKEKMPKNYKQLKNKGITKIPATVTFNDTVPLEEFKSLINESKVKLERFYIRTIDENGTPGTISGIPKGNELISMEIVNSIVEGPVKMSIEGVYAFDGELSTNDNSFNNLNEDPRIFAVDVSELIIKEEVEGSKKYKNKKDTENLHLDVDVHNLFWAKEKIYK